MNYVSICNFELLIVFFGRIVKENLVYEIAMFVHLSVYINGFISKILYFLDHLYLRRTLSVVIDSNLRWK